MRYKVNIATLCAYVVSNHCYLIKSRYSLVKFVHFSIIEPSNSLPASFILMSLSIKKV
ncbi:hypothetical protein VINE108521_00555 [Vibrio neonatus]